MAVVTLGLGIGSSLALLSALDAVHGPLRVHEPERVILLAWSAPTAEMAASVDDRPVVDPQTGVRASRSFSTLAFERFREASPALESVFAFARLEQLNVRVDGEAEIASGQLVSGGYYAGLGGTMTMGRSLMTSDDDPASPPRPS